MDTKSTFYTDIARELLAQNIRKLRFSSIKYRIQRVMAGKWPMLTVVMMSEISVLSASSSLIG